MVVVARFVAFLLPDLLGRLLLQALGRLGAKAIVRERARPGYGASKMAACWRRPGAKLWRPACTDPRERMVVSLDKAVSTSKPAARQIQRWCGGRVGLVGK